MKPEHLKLFAILLLASPTAVIASEYDMAFVNEKVTPLAAKLSSIPKHLRMADDTIDLLATTEFQALRTKCTADWEQIAANIDKVQGGDEAIKLVIYAFENLSPQNYMTLIERLVSKYESGVIGEGIVRSLFRPQGKMGAFAIDNYNHSRMTTVLNRIKNKTKTAAIKVDIDDILGGNAKSQLDDYRDNLAGTPEGDIPKVILPP